jgi:mitogen-activated protein kinase kinase kinase 11
VSDFGLSHTVCDEDGVISTRTYGTVTHMPPELLLEGRMSKAADVYSFGARLRACGRVPSGERSKSES